MALREGWRAGRGGGLAEREGGRECVGREGRAKWVIHSSLIMPRGGRREGREVSATKKAGAGRTRQRRPRLDGLSVFLSLPPSFFPYFPVLLLNAL